MYLQACLYVLAADPADKSLVYDRVDTGQQGEQKHRVTYKRGIYKNKSVNNATKDLLPARCTGHSAAGLLVHII